MTLKQEINTLLQAGVTKNHFPGAMYAVVSPTKVLCKDYIGYKQRKPTPLKLQGNEIYDVASLTKVISTTTLIMKLIEKQQLTLQTKIISILKRFTHKEITIYDLLTHSSGLPADIPNAYTLQNKDMVLNYIYSVDLQYKTGSSIIYSDIGFILLGEVIQTITNQALNDVAASWIFNPLSMNDTSYRPKVSRCAPTEYRDDEVYQGFLQGLVHDEKSFALSGLSGHAGLFSTVDDIALFIQMFLRIDNVVLNSKTQDELFKTRIEKTSTTNRLLKRALGWDKPTKGGTAGDLVHQEQTIVHTGFTGCNIWIDRYHEIGFIMLSNGVHPARENNRILQYRNTIGNLIMQYKKDGRL